MKRNICLTSTLRQPARLVLFLVLTGLISFAFIASAVQYIVVQRETNRLSGYYRAVASLASDAPDFADVTEAAAVVSKSPYVEFEDRRREVTGVLQGMKNTDYDGQSSDRFGSAKNIGLHVSDMFVYAELLSISADKTFESLGDNGCYAIVMRVGKVITGYPEVVCEGKVVTFLLPLDDYESGNSPVDEMVVGQRYLIRGRDYYSFKHLIITGDDTIFLGTRIIEDMEPPLFFQPLTGNGPWFIQVSADGEVDTETPAMAELAFEIALLQENQSAMRAITTRDMSAIPNMQEASRLYYLTEGRWLTREDDLNERKVCVVHHVFAMTRGLSVGDKITMKFRDLDVQWYGYIIDGVDMENWQNYTTYEDEFEIVGMYGLNLGNSTVQPLSRSLNLYIPDSCLQAGYGENTSPGYYSFTLKSTEYEEMFVAETRTALEELGVSVLFVENNARDFWASVKPVRTSSVISISVFTMVLILTQSLTAFLYLRARRREYAIMRALGTQLRAAEIQLILPMVLIGVVGTATGGAFAWNYALAKVAETLGTINGPDGVEISAGLPVLWLAGLCVGALLVMVLLLTVGILSISHRPVLELLQNIAAAAARKQEEQTKKDEDSAKTGETLAVHKALRTGGVDGNSDTAAPPLLPAERLVYKPLPVRATVRYMIWHIIRSPIKSILASAVAMAFLLALGWMTWMIESNRESINEMYASVVVEGEIVKVNPSVSVGKNGIIRQTTVDSLMDSGFVKDVYLEMNIIFDYITYITRSSIDERAPKPFENENRILNIEFIGFSDAEVFFATTGRNITVEYAPFELGWNDTMYMTVVEYGLDPQWETVLYNIPWSKEFSETQYGIGLPVIMHKATAAQLGLDFLDPFFLHDNRVSSAPASWGGIVTGIYEGKIDTAAAPNAHPYPVVMPLKVLTMLEERLERVGLGEYSTVRFTLDAEKNRDIDTFRKLMTAQLNSPDAGSQPLRLLLWDEELRQVTAPMERNLQLLSVLFPVTTAVSVLIAAGLGILLMFQNSKRAAIIRVLGSNKRRARFILCTEQLLLCIIGVLTSLIVLAVIRQDVYAAISPSSLMSAALYIAGSVLGSVIAAIAITNRMPLELLQVRE